MVSETEDGKVVYRASRANCISFPLSGDATLMGGVPRNFEIFNPLDFLAEVTQHVPNKGEHQVRYYGYYSNKMRGVRLKMERASAKKATAQKEKGSVRQHMTWAMLIKAVYEVDPLSCPKCGGTMKIISFIEDDDVIRTILKHCQLWKDPAPRSPPKLLPDSPQGDDGTLQYDDSFFEDTMYCDMM